MSIHHSRAHGEWLYNADWLTNKEKDKLSILDSKLKKELPQKVFESNKNLWDILDRVTKYYERYSPRRRHVLERSFLFDEFKSFLQNSKYFTEYSKFKIVSLVRLSGHIKLSTNKKEDSGWDEMQLGRFMSLKDREHVYMTASGSNLSDYRDVLNSVYPHAYIIKVYGASKYNLYERFGFKKLKNLPLTKDENTKYEVPYRVHSAHTFD